MDTSGRSTDSTTFLQLPSARQRDVKKCIFASCSGCVSLYGAIWWMVMCTSGSRVRIRSIIGRGGKPALPLNSTNIDLYTGGICLKCPNKWHSVMFGIFSNWCTLAHFAREWWLNNGRKNVLTKKGRQKWGKNLHCLYVEILNMPLRVRINTGVV